jgi:HlyD family secretion protein
MQVSTVGGVIAPGATLLQIVPLSEGLEFDLKLDPKSIDQVFVGQRAKVQFTAFSSRTTPEVHGTVSAISPTSVTDPANGQSFYRLKLQIAPEELARLGTLELVPGMPMEAFLQTSERSALAYLLKPLTDQLNRAFRDD